MNCENYLPLIDDLIEGEIEEQNAEQVNLHIFSCNKCSTYYKELKEEKEIYTRYLFDVEPPLDLWAKFQTKINTEKISSVLPSPETPRASFWKLNFFRDFRLYPAMGIAVVLVVLGLGLFKITFDKTATDDRYTARKDNKNTQAINNNSDETGKKEEMDSLAKIDPNNSVASSKKFVRSFDKTIPLNWKFSSETVNKAVAVKFTKKNERISSEGSAKKTLINDQPNEEQLRLTQLKILESETARQVEKAELLLRSFRNARVVDGSALYDVAYEKQQARKLLKQNVRLRQTAEAYGNLYARELLDKVETFLLDIANLENNPAEEKVLDIKERVKNQNIIASLQAY